MHSYAFCCQLTYIQPRKDVTQEVKPVLDPTGFHFSAFLSARVRDENSSHTNWVHCECHFDEAYILHLIESEHD